MKIEVQMTFDFVKEGVKAYQDALWHLCTVKTVIWQILSIRPENKVPQSALSLKGEGGVQSLFEQCPNRGLNIINGASLRDACKTVAQKNIHRAHEKDGSKYAQYLMGHQPDVKDWYSSQMWERACSWIEVVKS